MGPSAAIATRSQSATALTRFVVALALTLLSGLVMAQQSSPKLTLEVDRTRVGVGEPIFVSVELVYSGMERQVEVQPPNFNGLRARQVNQQDRTFVNNGLTQFIKHRKWSVTPTQTGTYTIGPAQASFDNQNLVSSQVTITVQAERTIHLPEDLQGEGILFASSKYENVDSQLAGRIFLRPTISTTTPYVRQPVIVSYDLYLEADLRHLISNSPTTPIPIEDHDDAYFFELFSPSIDHLRSVQIGDREFLMSPVLRMAITPTQAGPLEINGFGLELRVSVTDSSSRRYRSPAERFFSEINSRQIPVVLPTQPIKLDVRPIPSQGQPAGYTGTVGDYTLDASIDQSEASTDDFLTYTVSISGRGTIEMADEPRVVQQGDFEVVATESSQTISEIDGDLGGNKTFEYILRPRRPGEIRLPSVHYPIFNYRLGRYEDLESAPGRITVTEGESGAYQLTREDALEAAKSDDPLLGLDYIKSGIEPSERRVRPLLSNPGVWLGQGGALALMGALAFRRRRLLRTDPRQIRRQNAWRQFEHALKPIRQRPLQTSEQRGEAAGQLESAIRRFVGDRFDIAPEGLTRNEIHDALRGEALPQESIERLLDVLDRCSVVHYAPGAAVADADLPAWSDEAASILREVRFQ